MGRADDRKAQYKKAVDPDAGRRRRDETRTQIRKAKKEGQLAKRRAAAAPTGGNVTSNGGDSMEQQDNKTPLPTLADIPGLIGTLQNASCSQQDRLNAVRAIRRMLSVPDNPPVKQLIDRGVLPVLIRYLSADDDATLQFETSWALTNLASTDFTRVVVEAGALPGLVRLLECPTADVREQAAWCLGNIAGDCPELRDRVLQSGALGSLLHNIQDPDNESLLKNVVWAVSNLCRGKPEPELSLVKDCIPAMAYVLRHHMLTADTTVDAFWALAYFSDGDDYRIQVVVDAQLIPHAIAAIEGGKSGIAAPALRMLGNIVSGNKNQTQAVLDAGILNLIPSLLQHAKKAIRKEAAWLLSNIAAGTPEQITLLFKPNIITTLVNLSCTSTWEVRREAIWAVSNLFCGASPNEVSILVELDGIEAMAEVLDLTDASIVIVALDAIEAVLRVGKDHSKPYDVFFDECEGVTKLEQLQHHTNDRIYNKVVSLIETFFGGEEDFEDENLEPGKSSSGDFYSFGIGGLASPSTSKVLFGSASAPATGNTPAKSPAAKYDFGFGGLNNMNA